MCRWLEMHRRARITVWTAMLIGGLGGWLLLRHAHAERAQAALLVGFSYFTPLAGGLVVWSAVLTVVQGRWAGPLEALTARALGFAPFSLLALAGLWIGSRRAGTSIPAVDHSWWLRSSFVFPRLIALLVLFWVIAATYVARRARGRGSVLGAWTLVIHGVVFSQIGFDLLRSRMPEWPNTLLGGYFFVSGTYTAVAAWILLAVWRDDATPERLRDLGKLLVAFSLLSAYLMYSQLLPQWYANLPVETTFWAKRMHEAPWNRVGMVLVAVVFFGPLVALLLARSKESPSWLALVAAAVLVGMWIERWWLVRPTFGARSGIGWEDAVVTVAFVGALALGGEIQSRWGPRLPEREVVPS